MHSQIHLGACLGRAHWQHGSHGKRGYGQASVPFMAFHLFELLEKL